MQGTATSTEKNGVECDKQLQQNMQETATSAGKKIL